MNYHKYIDTHIHLDDKKFESDRDSVVQSFYGSVDYIINPAVNLRSCKKVKGLTEKYEFLYATYGIHPHDAKDVNDTALVAIEKLLKEKKAVGVGEIGLDYHYNFSPKEEQIRVFKDFLQLAKKINKPVVIHNRESDIDMLKILEETYPSGNILGQCHCFSSNKEMAEILIKMGFHISFTGSITFGKNKYAEIVDMVPMDKLLLETDGPYMAPIPFRGQRCDSLMIPQIVKKIAEIKNIDEETVYNQTYNNSIKLFQLKSKADSI
jgi:TatD DNase family protein